MREGERYKFRSATALPRYVDRNGLTVTLLWRANTTKPAWMVRFPATEGREHFIGLAFECELFPPAL